MKKYSLIFFFLFVWFESYSQNITNGYWQVIGKINYTSFSKYSSEALPITSDKYGNLYASGKCVDTSFYYEVVVYNGGSWHKLGAGIKNYLFPNNDITSIAVDKNQNVYVGYLEDTAFHKHAYNAFNILKWNGSTWQKIGRSTLEQNYSPNSGIWVGYFPSKLITCDTSGNVYAIGNYNKSNALFDRVQKYNGTNWISLGNDTIFNQANFTSQSVIDNVTTDANGNLFAGGHFADSVYNTYRCIKWDSGQWKPVGQPHNNYQNIIYQYYTHSNICFDKFDSVYCTEDSIGVAFYPQVSKLIQDSLWHKLPDDSAGFKNNNCIAGFNSPPKLAFDTLNNLFFSTNGTIVYWNGVHWQQVANINQYTGFLHYLNNNGCRGVVYSLTTIDRNLFATVANTPDFINSYNLVLKYTPSNCIIPNAQLTCNDSTICTSSTALLQTNIIGSKYHYQWQWNGFDLQGDTLSSLHVTGTIGKYNLLITDSAGCSAVTKSIFVSINSPSFDTLYKTICNNQPYNFHNHILTQSGWYNDTIQNHLGCDSIITLHLTVKPISQTIITQTTCSNQPVLFNNHLLNTVGIYLDTLNNYWGCDSLVTLHLTIKPTSHTSITQTICSGNTYNFNNQTLTTSGIYFDTLQNYLGCDSFITLHLIVNNTATNSVSASICTHEQYIFHNHPLTVAGIYTDTFQTYSGCDSIVTLHLSVINLDTSLTQIHDTLISNAIACTYQWFNCDSNKIIIGADSISFKPSTTGHYAVILTSTINQNCVDTSGCRLIQINTGIESFSINNSSLTIYPNPTNNSTTITLTKLINNATIKLTNITGQTILLKQNQTGNQFTLDLTNQPQGFYFIEVQQQDKIWRSKIVKQ